RSCHLCRSLRQSRLPLFPLCNRGNARHSRRGIGGLFLAPRNPVYRPVVSSGPPFPAASLQLASFGCDHVSSRIDPWNICAGPVSCSRRQESTHQPFCFQSKLREFAQLPVPTAWLLCLAHSLLDGCDQP